MTAGGRRECLARVARATEMRWTFTEGIYRTFVTGELTVPSEAVGCNQEGRRTPPPVPPRRGEGSLPERCLALLEIASDGRLRK